MKRIAITGIPNRIILSQIAWTLGRDKEDCEHALTLYPKQFPCYATNDEGFWHGQNESFISHPDVEKKDYKTFLRENYSKEEIIKLLDDVAVYANRINERMRAFVQKEGLV
jgi:hypothetical protein